MRVSLLPPSPLLVTLHVTFSSEKHFNRWGRNHPPTPVPRVVSKMHDVFLFIPIAGFLHHHNHTCSESPGFRDEPNFHLLLEGVVLPPTPSSRSLPLQTPELGRRKAAGYTGKKTRLRDLESSPWGYGARCMHRERPEARPVISLCFGFSIM